MSSDPRVNLGAGLPDGASDEVLGALDRVRIVIRLGAELTGPAANAAGALVSMLSRVHPHVRVEGDARLGPNPWGAATVTGVLALLAPLRPPAGSDVENELVVAVGDDVALADLWVGGDDWTARMGRRPVPIGPGAIGLGLQGAAALAAAELAKLVLGPLGMIHVPAPEHLEWNLLDHRLAPASATMTEWEPPVVALLGAGSVGSSVAGLLVLAGRPGSVWVVDPDTFDAGRNPFRYPSSTPGLTGSKAAWLAGILSRAEWRAEASSGTVGDWVANRPAPGFDGIAVSSVDSVCGRLQVADLLARTTITLGVGGLALHVQREHLGDGWACPFCQFVVLDPPMTQIQVHAQLTGLRLERVAELRLNGGAGVLTGDDVATAVRAGRLHPDRAPGMVGRRLDDLVRGAYAEASVPVSGAEPAAVSAPYVSWTAGVLGAAEIIKATTGLPLVDRRVDLDLSGVPLGLVSRRPADASGRCVCGPGLRRRWSARLWGDYGDRRRGAALPDLGR